MSTAASAAAAAVIQAIGASGAIVKVDPEQFEALLMRAENPLVVIADGGFLQKKHSYLTNYRGFFFFTATNEPVGIPANAELVEARSIWVP
ncbi:MAG TPA: hypothetical protein VGM37_10160 [Armatimonadota bacterium]|jgi:hypothetical protein